MEDEFVCNYPINFKSTGPLHIQTLGFNLEFEVIEEFNFSEEFEVIEEGPSVRFFFEKHKFTIK